MTIVYRAIEMFKMRVNFAYYIFVTTRIHRSPCIYALFLNRGADERISKMIKISNTSYFITICYFFFPPDFNDETKITIIKICLTYTYIVNIRYTMIRIRIKKLT